MMFSAPVPMRARAAVPRRNPLCAEIETADTDLGVRARKQAGCITLVELRSHARVTGAHAKRESVHGRIAWHRSVPRVDLLVRSMLLGATEASCGSAHQGLPWAPGAKGSRAVDRSRKGVGCASTKDPDRRRVSVTRQGTGRHLADWESWASACFAPTVMSSTMRIIVYV